jgi:hypothetical protein
MTRDEALAVVVEAAERWATEIVEYIEPGAPEDERASWAEQAQRIGQATQLLQLGETLDERVRNG